MSNLANNLVATATRSPAAVAIKLDDVEVTFGALEVLSQKVATLLAGHGVRRGDRVALIMPNIPQMAFVYYGILRAGAVVVPLNPLLKGREVAYHLTDSGARLVFAWEGIIAEAQSGAEASGTERGDEVTVVTVEIGRAHV